jgi:hypothetical protein
MIDFEMVNGGCDFALYLYFALRIELTVLWVQVAVGKVATRPFFRKINIIACATSVVEVRSPHFDKRGASIAKKVIE